MSHTNMILSALLTMVMVIFIAPNVFVMNRGHILRNIALWLGFFLVLGLIYQNLGPDSPHPLFQLPDSLVGMRTVPHDDAPHDEAPASATPTAAPTTSKDTDSQNNGSQGFTPPKE